MNFLDQELMYEFQANDLTQTDAIKQYADHIVKEIKSQSGWDTFVQVHIKPEAKDKHLFTVSMSVHGLGESIIACKEGKNVMAVLRKVRKGILRQVHRLSKKRIGYRRKQFWREQFAS